MEIKNKRRGQPYKLEYLDRQHFEDICKLCPSKEEVSNFFHCDPRTLTNFCQREFGMSFKEAREMFEASAKLSLRRDQVKAAHKGNVTMQIWLGKNWLKQTDRIAGSISIENPQAIADLIKINDDELEKIRKANFADSIVVTEVEEVKENE